MDKEIKITPPEGYEIDKENSTFNCIKFKPKEKIWRDDTTNILTGYFIGTYSDIITTKSVNSRSNYNVFATEKQAKSALAMARISQIMVNDKRFGGVVTDGEWNNNDITKYVIERCYGDEIHCEWYYNLYHFLAFHTAKQRDLFLKENRDLVKDYLMID